MKFKNDFLAAVWQLVEAEEGKEISRGARRALRCYLRTLEAEQPEFTVNSMDGWWLVDVEGAVELLRAAGVKTIHWFDNGSNYLEVFHAMDCLGVVIRGTIKVPGRFDTEECGLVFEITNLA